MLLDSDSQKSQQFYTPTTQAKIPASPLLAAVHSQILVVFEPAAITADLESRPESELKSRLDGGHLRISTFRSSGTHILPDVLAEYCQRYPAIAIDIREYDDRTEVEDDLRKGRFGLVGCTD